MDPNITKEYLKYVGRTNDVIIYANSTILGRITIGKNATIGGNVWVDKDVPADGKISQKGKQL